MRDLAPSGASELFEPAFVCMAFDAQATLLQAIEHADSMAAAAGPLMREITGARAVILAVVEPAPRATEPHPADGVGLGLLPLRVEPERRAALAEDPEVAALLRHAHAARKVAIWQPGADAAGPPGCLARLGLGLSLGVPLRIGDDPVGTLLLLGLPDTHTMDQVVATVANLAPIVALALRQAVRSDRQQDERDRLAAVVETSQDFVALCDMSDRLLYLNEAGRQLVGLPEERRSTSTCAADYYPPDQWERVRSEVFPAVRAEGAWRGPLELQHFGSAERVPVDASMVLIRRPGRDEPLCKASVLRDRRPLLAAAAREAKLADELRHAQRLQAVGQLAGGVAHDFNNLLTVIMGTGEMLIDDLDPGDRSRAELEEILAAARRAEALTRQLLAFGRRQILAPTNLDLNAIVTALDRMLRRIIGEDIALESALSPDLGVVRADRGQLEQVLMNLAVNARDAMPDGGRLTFETANAYVDERYQQRDPEVAPGPYVVLSVSDDGGGMSPEVKRRIFEPFFTTKGLGRGTGLGLATVYGIVKQSGGFVLVYSELGRGTTFKIYLPRLAGAAVSPAEPPLRAATSEGGRGERVLVVEDEAVLGRMMLRVLGAAGYRVQCAGSWSEVDAALERLGGRADLLLTDVVMPELSGKQVADELRRRQPGLAVVFTSGYSENAIHRHGVLEPGARFLPKPFSLKEILSAVRAALEQSTRDGPPRDGGSDPAGD